MSIAPGFVLIRLWGRDRRPGAGGRLAPRARAEPATGERRGTWSKAGWGSKRRAYAPPQRPPTRSPPISRDTNTTVAAAHTLTRVGGAKPPRPGASFHTAKTANEAHRCDDSRLHTFSTHLARRRPGTVVARTRPSTRRHSRGSSGDGGSEALLQEICGGTNGLVKRCATAHVTSVWATLAWLGAPDLSRAATHHTRAAPP
jgi:hypothetical protein